MGKITDTLWEIEPHTEAKHAILRKYLNAWLPILTSSHGRVLIIDGFAGPGEYKCGKEGSPIIAIKSVIEHKIDIKSEVIFIFIESDEKRYEFLEKKLEDIKLPKNITYTCKCAEFANVINEILDYISKNNLKLAPTFVFIDPFGFKGIPFDTIKRLMENDRCEVLINFMFEEVNRFIELPQFKDLYTNLFGTSEWQKVKGEKNTQKRLQILHNTYKNQLEKIAGFVVSFKMTNKFNKTDYFLFFATKHILGLKKMKESMWKVDPKGSFEFSDATYDPNQTVLFEQKPNFNLLKKNILQNYKGKKVNIEDLENFILVKTPFRETHYKLPILKPMEEKNEIKVYNDKKRRKGTYPQGTVIEFL